MSAKKAKKASAPTPLAPSVSLTATAAPLEENTSEVFVPWIESSDPKKRQIAKVVLAGLWIYVAALGLLALDQWFSLGIFGPKIPPLP